MNEEQMQIVEQVVRSKKDIDNDLIVEDYKNRVITLNEIDDQLMSKVGNHIIKWNRDDSEIFNSTVEYVKTFCKDEAIDVESIAQKCFKPITLKISSYGGSTIEGFGLIDIIRNSNTPIIGVNMDLAASMGALIYSSCHLRYSMPSAEVLYHDGHNGNITTTHKFLDYAKYVARVEEKVKELVLETTEIGEELYDKNVRVEWYINAKDAKEKYGITDGIIGEDIEMCELL